MFELIENNSTTCKVVLSIGSNIGNPKQNIDLAIDLLLQYSVLEDIKISSYYLTEPNGYITNNWITNVSVSGNTKLTPFTMLFFIKSIEYHLGRIKKQVISDRLIDIDILLWGDKSINTKHLEVPHPRLHKRKFALIPTIEIEPNFIHPAFCTNLETILKECPDTSQVIKQ